MASAREINNGSTLRVAVVGAGPSGFYATQALFRADRPIQVDLFERLPSPFGLVRSGVAPDHPKLKRPIELYQRIADTPDFTFVGNVCIGQDLAVETLRQHYHAVIFANGSESARPMGIPGESLVGCHSATAFVGWYNGHPDYRDEVIDVSCETAVVIGQGNVAVDVCRILTKTVDELRHTDIAQHALDVLADSRIREVHLIGRRGPLQAKFTHQELKELGVLEACTVEVDSEELLLNSASETELNDTTRPAQDNARNYKILKRFAETSSRARPRRCRLRFLLSPTALKGNKRLQQVILEKNQLSGPAGKQLAQGTGVLEKIDCGLLISSIGYRGSPISGLPFDRARGMIPNREGRIFKGDEPIAGLYTVGWIKRGPTGLIGTNKADAKETVNALLNDFSQGTPSPRIGLEGLRPALSRLGIEVISYSTWQRIDDQEIARGAAKTKPREKFTRVSEMLTIAKPGATTSGHSLKPPR